MGKKIKFQKNDKRRVKAVCKGNGCQWFVYAYARNDKRTFQIMSMLLHHTCGRTSYHGLTNYSFLCDKYLENIRLNPHYKVSDFVIKVHNDLGVNITRNQAYRAKKKTRQLIEENYNDQYDKLWDYCEELEKINLGSNVFLTTTENDEEEDEFQRLYVCLNTCKKGFIDSCRLVVGLDRCHLRVPHKGVLLTAVGIDPNDQLYPIVYDVVETENKKTWKWFITELKHDLGIRNKSTWTFITDKQKGLVQTIYELLPDTEHRMCVRHMYNNFKKDHAGLALKDRIWAATRACYPTKFAVEMESLKEFDELAYKWLLNDTTPKEWTMPLFRTAVKCDILLNNLCENFNSIILESRKKSILDMLETIRFYLMVRMEKKREWMKKYTGTLCPKIQKKLEIMKEATNGCNAALAGDWKYEIRCMYGDRHIVDLLNRSCSCRKWDLTRIPCAHAVATISLTQKEPELFVHECYSKEAYLKSYEPVISPMNTIVMWTKFDMPYMYPPRNIKLPGRPRKVRRREPDESMADKNNKKYPQKLSRVGQMIYKCKKCKQPGHNSRKCPQKENSVVDENTKKVRQQNGQTAPTPETRTSPIPDVVTCPTPETTTVAFEDSIVGPSEAASQNTTATITSVAPTLSATKIGKYKCGVCRRYGHTRATCSTAVAKLYGTPTYDLPYHLQDKRKNTTSDAGDGDCLNRRN